MFPRKLFSRDDSGSCSLERLSRDNRLTAPARCGRSQWRTTTDLATQQRYGLDRSSVTFGVHHRYLQKYVHQRAPARLGSAQQPGLIAGRLAGQNPSIRVKIRPRIKPSQASLESRAPPAGRVVEQDKCDPPLGTHHREWIASESPSHGGAGGAVVNRALMARGRR